MPSWPADEEINFRGRNCAGNVKGNTRVAVDLPAFVRYVARDKSIAGKISSRNTDERVADNESGRDERAAYYIKAGCLVLQ